MMATLRQNWDEETGTGRHDSRLGAVDSVIMLPAPMPSVEPLIKAG